MSRILDPKFRYVPAEHMGPDYLRKRFARIRRDQEKAKLQHKATVQPMKRKAA